MNTYNIYKNGKLSVQNVTTDIVRMSTGIAPSNIRRYMGEVEYPSKDGNNYRFEFYSTSINPFKSKIEDAAKWWTENDKERWEKYRFAVNPNAKQRVKDEMPV